MTLIRIDLDAHSDFCELCGEFAVLRPYGPKGEKICLDCGMKDQTTTERQMLNTMFGGQDDKLPS